MTDIGFMAVCVNASNAFAGPCRKANPLRAIKIRVAALEEEQAAAAAEFEGLRACGDAILAEMADRQQRLREFRELLLNSGEAAVSPTWLPQAHVANGGIE